MKVYLFFRIHQAGIFCPEPILLRSHVLVMSFIGTDGWLVYYVEKDWSKLIANKMKVFCGFLSTASLESPGSKVWWEVFSNYLHLFLFFDISLAYVQFSGPVWFSFYCDVNCFYFRKKSYLQWKQFQKFIVVNWR